MLEAITFAERPGKVYFRAQDLAKEVRVSYQLDTLTEIAKLNGTTIPVTADRLWDGSYLIEKKELSSFALVLVKKGKRDAFTIGQKTVRVDLDGQRLRAFQGGIEVIRCRISSGREGKETPVGKFKLGAKQKDKVSTTYGSPMPWSVHITGPYYIHGSNWFSYDDASHGCIRLEIHGPTNWAETFYQWVDPGTPLVLWRRLLRAR
ncbi:MAG: L,D-transpeptidase [Armatimonadetes bacterium]|nr:L,D-transpeptidase [Armatimonadota bacterium]